MHGKCRRGRIFPVFHSPSVMCLSQDRCSASLTERRKLERAHVRVLRLLWETESIFNSAGGRRPGQEAVGSSAVLPAEPTCTKSEISTGRRGNPFLQKMHEISRGRRSSDYTVSTSRERPDFHQTCLASLPKHYDPPPSSFLTSAPALEKSIWPAKRVFSAAMVRPMSFSVAASSSRISDEMASAASRSDIRDGM
jgi:hypothetical protein